MPLDFPYPLPLNAYAGLGNGYIEIAGANYTRQPLTLELTEDGYTVSNVNTLQWCVARSDWGPVSSVLVFDAPTGGNLLFMLLLSGAAAPYNWGDYSAGLYSPTTPPPLVVHMYDRPRISAAGLTVIAVDGAPVGYGTGGFGRFAYATGPAAEGTANVVILTFAAAALCNAATWDAGPSGETPSFAAVSLCSPGTWAAGPCACDCPL